MRVTGDALAVARPIWMVGDSAYDTLHIEYRIEECITEHSEDVQLKQSTLEET
jgi:hypothetical protein